MLTPDTIYIRSLQVIAGDAAPARALPSALAAARLHPSNLPPAAILCVRRLRHWPTPLRLERGALRPPAVWERAVASELERLARAAARPALGPVPAAAEAVLFADRAELLACLAADSCAGTLADAWWWRDLLRAANLAAAVAPAWLAAPAYIPAALQQLAERRLTTPFARSLGPAEAMALLAAAVSSFGAAELAAALAAPPGSAPHTPRPRGASASPPPPWEPWASGEAPAALALGQRLLVGVGLALCRAPTAARAPWFAAALRRWLQADATGRTPGLSPSSLPAASPTTPGPQLTDGSEAPHPPPDHPAAPRRASVGRLHPAPQRPGRAARVAREVAPVAWPATAQPQAAATALVAQGPPAAPAARIIGATPGGVWVSTGYGGLFYLINLALHLGLYGDFTSPARPGLALPVWDFLALVGERLIGPALRADPLWPLLAELAGRSPDEPPGAGFAPPRRRSFPRTWLEQVLGTLLPTGDEGRAKRREALTTADEGRARAYLRPSSSVFRPQPVGDFRQAALDPLDTGGRRSSVVGRRRPARRSTLLRRWLGRVVPYIEARLRLGLGLAPDEDLAGLLFARPARISVTGAHLTVALALAELPIAVRLAGLDRDPGWVPAAGRDIRFLFTAEELRP